MNIRKAAHVSLTSVYVIIVIITMFLSACDSGNPQYHIGVSQCSDDEWRTQMNEEIRREMLFHDDADVEIRTSDDDNTKQISDIEYFIKNNFDLIIVSPRESKAITPVIRKAYEKGIPVIVFDRAIDGDYYTSYMKLDNEGIGRSAAEYVARMSGMGQTHVIELRGLDDSSPARDRHAGFQHVIDSLPRITVSASVPAYWKKEPAYKAVDSLVKLHPEVNVIYAHNDLMALGAAEAIRNNGRRDIKIVGTDGAPSLGMKAVADSMIDVTFIYPTEGERVIRNAIAILKGQHFDKIDHVPAQHAIDKTNAEILLRQNKLLTERTNQIEVLNSRNNLIRNRQQAQLYLLIASAVALVLLIIAIFFLFRYLRQRQYFEKILTDKNIELSREKTRQEELYNQLELATKSKLAFFTNVSHDLRTPITLITEPVEQVASAPYLTAQHRSLMQLALRNLKILHRLIEQILDFRKYQNGKTDLHLVELSPTNYVKEWSDAFRGIAAKRRIKYNVQLYVSDDITTALDIDKFERIFFNIVANAFKYTHDGGKIDIEFHINEKNLVLQVSDTGIGMSEEEVKHIFERFYQVDKINPTGSGIGLSLTKAFIELMGGIISIDSTPGEGSVFTVTIPVKHVSPEGTSKEIPNPKETMELKEEILASVNPREQEVKEFEEEKPLVLVIDDNPDILSLVETLLYDSYNIITATDGTTGLRLAKRYVPDLVICDIMMPGMDGLECCRMIKDEITTSHIPVLILTACKVDEQRVESYESGADGYISKPFPGVLLLARVKNLLLNRKRIHDLYAEHIGLDEKPSTGKSLPPDNDMPSVESEFYRRFFEIVKAHFRNSELGVKDISSELGMGAAQLSRKIKALTGLTPVDLIRKFRLREARKNLLTTELSISEIAYEVGFSSPQYFSKCFKDEYSQTPSELRQS